MSQDEVEKQSFNLQLDSAHYYHLLVVFNNYNKQAKTHNKYITSKHI